MAPEKYAKELNELAEEFVKETIANAEELAVFTSDAVKRIEGKHFGDIYASNCHPITFKEAEKLLAPANEKLTEQVKQTSEIRKTVNRIDKRDKKRGQKRKYTPEQLNTCQHYWDLGRKNQTVKDAAKNKVTRKLVFEYYKRELSAIGIADTEMFADALTRRSKNISKHQKH